CVSESNTSLSLFSFFHGTATAEIYTLSLHDALPISLELSVPAGYVISGSVLKSFKKLQDALGAWHDYIVLGEVTLQDAPSASWRDRKSTRLNSSHVEISYAVFCLKKKKHNSAGRG